LSKLIEMRWRSERWWRTVSSNLIEQLEVSFTTDSCRSQVGQNMGNWDIAWTSLDYYRSDDSRLA
jgi:hypothetical protein